MYFVRIFKVFRAEKRVREQVLEYLFVGNSMAGEIKHRIEVFNELICKFEPIQKVSASNLVSTLSSSRSNILVASGGHTEVSVFQENTVVSTFKSFILRFCSRDLNQVLYRST